MTPLLRIALYAEHDIVLARQRVRQVAALLGLASATQTRMATAVSEIARNAYQYGDAGRVDIAVNELEGDRSGSAELCIRVSDRGKGIADLATVLDGQYRSRTGLGLGLRGARQLVDRFEIKSQPGETVVELGQTLPRTPRQQDLRSVIDEMAKQRPGDAFTEVLQQNQELLQTQEALARANAELANADQSKDHFMAMLGHELRNLLNALRSGLEVLTRDPAPALRERMQTLAIGQTEHLRRLVEDLLDASQIQRGQLEVRAVPLDLTIEVEAMLESWKGEVETAGLTLRLEHPDEPLWTQADPTRLAQVVSNLLSNACKFTDPGGEILVTVAPAGDHARLVVADTGCGMKKDALERVFEPFAQTSEAKKRMTGGLGLGLAIVRGLVLSHGGAMWAESDGPGHGTRFIVDLPAVEHPGADTVLLPLPEPDDLRILLIDDHRASVEGLAELLRLEGHAVDVAFDGPSALQLFPEFKPDIVLCDLGLPEMDGFEVARRLRKTQGGADLRLLALSGFADPESKRQALEAGFNSHLSKPVNVVDLLRHLRDYKS